MIELSNLVDFCELRSQRGLSGGSLGVLGSVADELSGEQIKKMKKVMLHFREIYSTL